jgi:hypothetical protein
VTLAGVIAMDVSVGCGTVTVLMFDVTAPMVAVIEMGVALLPRSVAIPVLAVLTTAGLDDTQVTREVTFAVVPLL